MSSPGGSREDGELSSTGEQVAPAGGRTPPPRRVGAEDGSEADEVPKVAVSPPAAGDASSSGDAGCARGVVAVGGDFAAQEAAGDRGTWSRDCQ